MKIRLNIQQRIQFLILGFATIIFIISIVYIGYSARVKMLNEAKLLTESIAEEYAAKLEKNLEADMSITRTLARIQEKYVDFDLEKRREIIAKAYVNVLKENAQIDAIWDSWDLGALGIQTDSIVRYSYMCWWENGLIKENINPFTFYSPSFNARKHKGTDNIREPYLYKYPGEPDSVLLTDLSTPVFDITGKYIGSAAIDFRLTRFHEIVSKIKPYKDSESNALLLGTSGSCIGHTKSEMLGMNIKEIYPLQTRNYDVLEKIKNGESFSFQNDLSDGDSYYFTFTPIKIGDTGTPWSLGIVIPIKKVYETANKTLRNAFIVGIIGLLVLSLVIWIISRNIIEPLKKITESLRGLSKGKIGKEMLFEINTGDEIAEIGEAFNNSIEALSEKAKFAEEIGNNNLDAEIELLGDEDILGESLIEMRDRLRKAKIEEEKLKEIDLQRQWLNEGLSKFGEILRLNNDNLENLSYEVISNLVNYLEANQGSIYSLNDDDGQDLFLEIKAAYAYKRRKYLSKKIYLGDGLVGACAVDGERVCIEDLPQEYVEITSGFGDENPTNLLLIPLKFEEKILGVIEIISYKVFEKYQIDFIEKIAENIASSISSVRISEQTTLLLEQSRHQAEELAAHEEEMRQNMEELQATQEEAARKQVEMKGLLNALNMSSYVMEYDFDKRVVSINDAFLKIYGLDKKEIIGKYHHDTTNFKEIPLADDPFWNAIRDGKIKKQRSIFSIKGKEYDLLEIYAPLKDEYGEIYKIMKIADDMNDYRS